MMRLNVFIVSVALLIFASCNKDEEEGKVYKTDLKNVENYSFMTNGLASKYALDDCFLDLNLSRFDMVSGTRSGEGYIDSLAKVKAIIYRFYSNVHLDGDSLLCNVNFGSDINISEDNFKLLYDNLKEMNDFIYKNKLTGRKTYISPIDSIYLASLLN